MFSQAYSLLEKLFQTAQTKLFDINLQQESVFPY